VSIESPPSSESNTTIDAFADFYRQHYPNAVRLAWLLTHEHSLTEDVVQDAFVRLQPKFLEVAERTAYLRMCVVNGCRDRARSDVRSTRRLRLLSAVAATSSNDHPSELLDAVARLPYNQRAVVVLRYWADLPEAEIAEITGVRPGTVRTLAARAIATLRKDLPR
jgi:RNA polymerase sigma factor (sigma-70 family)